jgi:hypothetical protein
MPYVLMFGTMAIALMFAFTLAGLNMSLARSFRRLQKAEKDRASGPGWPSSIHLDLVIADKPSAP